MILSCVAVSIDLEPNTFTSESKLLLFIYIMQKCGNSYFALHAKWIPFPQILDADKYSQRLSDSWSWKVVWHSCKHSWHYAYLHGTYMHWREYTYYFGVPNYSAWLWKSVVLSCHIWSVASFYDVHNPRI